jgi:serine/threonine protein kinase
MAQSVEIAVQCLRGLAHTHRHGIIHRDIKPSNIILGRDEAGRHVPKLMDFGIARLEENDPDTFSLTRPGEGSPGTPLFMSPEQIDSVTYGKVTTASDIYAMGALLYTMLAGRPPFGGTLTDIYNGHLNFKPKPIVRRDGLSVPSPLVAVIARSMEKQPAARYPSASAFTDALRCVAAGGVLEPAGSVDRRKRSRLACKITKWSLGSAFILMLLTGLYIGSGTRTTVDVPAGATDLIPDGAEPEGPSRVLLPDHLTPIQVEIAESEGVAQPEVSSPPEPQSEKTSSPVPEHTASTEDPSGALATTNDSGSDFSADNYGLADAQQQEPTISDTDTEMVIALPAVDASRAIKDTPPSIEVVAEVSEPDSLEEGLVSELGPVEDAESDAQRMHTVLPGESLSKIALQYGIAPNDLAKWNLLRNPNALFVGQELYLFERPDLPHVEVNWGGSPPKQTSSTSQATPAPEEERRGGFFQRTKERLQRISGGDKKD